MIQLARPIGLLAWLALAACDLGTHEVIDGGGGPAGPSEGCSGACHGSGTSVAPPRDTSGRSDLSSIGVGAHQAHLGASDWHQRFQCVTCHTVPEQVGELGHMFVAGAGGTTMRDPAPAELAMTGLGAGTTWDHATGTCANSYCHGDTLVQLDPNNLMVSVGAGGTATKPVWTQVDGTQSACGACHGTPPPAPHPRESDCGLCHTSMNPGDFAAGKISYPELHINGKVEVVSTRACDSCHGGAGQAAPPRDVGGNVATTAPGVGAHAQHLTQTSTWHAVVACNECHTVPGSTTDQTHVNSVRDVMLDPAAGTGGLLQVTGATYDRTAHTCSSTYCHGGGASTLKGGTAMTPLWTRVDGTQSRCGSCHGAPPPAPHPQNASCGSCHPTMVAGMNTTIAYPAKHIDGNVDVTSDQPCDTCHGSGGNAAPPKDTTGATATNLRSIGAHRSHVGATSSSWRAPIACAACHRVPTSVTSLGHTDSALPAEITFGAIAGSAASWNGSTCSNVYCHGATLKSGGAPAGGTATRPVWTVVDGSQSQCGSCHGTPPPSPHPQDASCSTCHDTMMPGPGLVIADPLRHIDGNLDVNTQQACNTCHGTAANNAPPKDTLGNTATNTRGVGAHQSHLAPMGTRFKAIACTDCHTVPATVTALGHIDTALPAEVRFGARAGTSPAWNGAVCANVYCHGSTLTSGGGGAGGTATTPQWSKVDGSQRQCQSCHGFPPPAPHPQNSDCGACHDDVQAGSNTTFADAARHVDGVLDVTTNQACNSCHGSAANDAPPNDTSGGTTTTLRGVGAHQAHVATGSTWHATVACASCHRVPGAVNTVGHLDTPLPAELAFTGIAAGSTWNGSTCASYCHGATLAGGAATAPLWTKVDGTQAQCQSCHGLPPPAPHPQDTNCQNCHPNAGANHTITIAAQHIDGTLQVTAGANHPTGYEQMTMHGFDVDKRGTSSCATSGCHGVTLTGGTTGGPSCATVTGCHDKVGAGFTWQTQCTFCHGDITVPAGNGAPPQGVLGATAATDKTVGAHAKHLGATAMHGQWDCTMCHTKPSNALAPGHIDGTGGVVQAEVKYGALNPSGTFNAANATCASLYCHGNGRTSAGTATWTSTAPLDCNSCHKSPAPGQVATAMSGEHDKHIRDKRYACVTCHRTVVDGAPTIISAGLHVDGVKQVVMSQGTFNPATKACSGLANGCHGTKTW